VNDDERSSRRVFVVGLRPTADCADPVKALRFHLKAALRRHGLRCLEIREVPVTEPKKGENNE
jgi:hypothetical protein